ncbi:MAG: cell division protein FtsZ [Brevinematales bacterium]|nr:cell division protein FtsZ [Brevinematales bacterium]
MLYENFNELNHASADLFSDVNEEPITRIKVVGIGGAGCNAVNRMIQDGLSNVEFVAVNTDLQVLKNSLAKIKMQIGARSTRGLGAGAKPEVGEKAAQEDIEEIKTLFSKTDMIFITAGMGGGTGTGAAPVFAKVAKEMGILTVAVVTLPFDFEGKQRIDRAMQGINKLKENVDTMIVISNSRIFKVIERKAHIKNAFHKIDEVLKHAVQGISSIITDVGIINVDFADVRTVLSNKGEAIMGVGIGEGENRAVEAAKLALENPLIENTSFKNAAAVLVNIVGGNDFSMSEYYEAAQTITEFCRPDAEIIVGVNVDDNLKDKVKIILIATGFQKEETEVCKNPLSFDNAIEDRKVLSISEIRRERMKNRINIDQTFVNRSLLDEDYETPSFYRRQNKVN